MQEFLHTYHLSKQHLVRRGKYSKYSEVVHQQVYGKAKCCPFQTVVNLVMENVEQLKTTQHLHISTSIQETVRFHWLPKGNIQQLWPPQFCWINH